MTCFTKHIQSHWNTKYKWTKARDRKTLKNVPQQRTVKTQIKCLNAKCDENKIYESRRERECDIINE